MPSEIAPRQLMRTLQARQRCCCACMSGNGRRHGQRPHAGGRCMASAATQVVCMWAQGCVACVHVCLYACFPVGTRVSDDTLRHFVLPAHHQWRTAQHSRQTAAAHHHYLVPASRQQQTRSMATNSSSKPRAPRQLALQKPASRARKARSRPHCSQQQRQTAMMRSSHRLVLTRRLPAAAVEILTAYLLPHKRARKARLVRRWRRSRPRAALHRVLESPRWRSCCSSTGCHMGWTAAGEQQLHAPRGRSFGSLHAACARDHTSLVWRSGCLPVLCNAGRFSVCMAAPAQCRWTSRRSTWSAAS